MSRGYVCGKDGEGAAYRGSLWAMLDRVLVDYPGGFLRGGGRQFGIEGAARLRSEFALR